MLSYKGENFGRIIIILNGELGYFQKVKDRVKGLGGQKRFRIVVVGNVKGIQYEQGQKWLIFFSLIEVWEYEFVVGLLV